jgi:hypothetical protein
MTGEEPFLAGDTPQALCRRSDFEFGDFIEKQERRTMRKYIGG